MNIRIAGLDDIGSLYELNKLFDNETTVQDMKKTLITNDREIVCIAYMDNIGAGYCTGLIVKSICYNKIRLDVESLFIREEYRKKGIGEELVKFLEKEASARGIKHFHIFTNRNNIKAQALYKKLGYADTGEFLLDKTLE